ncbi:hydrolase [Stratiformator vulcanicus]|uniref:Isochorismatase family protein YecD n=1 Tax=Stratiformator vulcanicus TaxID=2527980 RepID=A0A517QY69_9PLAN|nr:hydrolase [Stratiformator vulcanicus]QDT36575.1 Isochorismatase family protein YecD [Stratiformator vulcanicus]
MSDMNNVRSPGLLGATQTTLFVIDIQERMLPHIHRGDDVVARCGMLVTGAKMLGIPVIATEQYPQGLGATVPALRELLPAELPSKKRFSAAAASGLLPVGERDDGRDRVLLCGIETHVCVLQTAFDLVSLGYRVGVAADAVSSRRDFDHDLALQRMRDSGIDLVSSEGALFEWCETAEHPAFKQISALVKEN